MTITGKRIKERRIELGWSLRDLAYKMGYSNQSSVARAESGEIDIPQSKVVKFAEVLGVSVAWLMGWTSEEEKTAIKDDSGMSEIKRRLIDLAEGCSEEEASKLLQMMELFLGRK